MRLQWHEGWKSQLTLLLIGLTPWTQAMPTENEVTPGITLARPCYHRLAEQSTSPGSLRMDQLGCLLKDACCIIYLLGSKKELFEKDILDHFCLLGLKKFLVLMAKIFMCKTIETSIFYLQLQRVWPQPIQCRPTPPSSLASHVLEPGLRDTVCEQSFSRSRGEEG